ncbi:MAG: thioredoxin family protein [Candidatus Bathyarchaeia archaeon]|nr:thioredoxin family protein [Candidatus Bathyarchaeota archaeon]
MKKVVAEVLGPNPPCYRCMELKKNVEAAAKRLVAEGIEVEVKRLDIISREAIRRYGLLLSPALTVNGVVVTMGWIPDEEVVEEILREAADKRS